MAQRTSPERDELELARAVWAEADAAHTELRDRVEGLGLALGSTGLGRVDARVSDRLRALAEPYMDLVSRPRGLKKATRQLENARDEFDDAQPLYEDARTAWEAAQRKRTNEIAGALQPRQRAAVKATAAALEALSKAIADEQQVRAELRSMAPLPESAKLPDLTGELLDMAISTWHSTAWHWSQKIQKLWDLAIHPSSDMVAHIIRCTC